MRTDPPPGRSSLRQHTATRTITVLAVMAMQQVKGSGRTQRGAVDDHMVGKLLEEKHLQRDGKKLADKIARELEEA